MSDGAREIENLVYTYAERLDAGDLDGVAALFAHGRICGMEDGPPETSGVATAMILNDATMELAAVNDPWLIAQQNALPIALVEPEQIAAAVTWLVSDAGKFITGTSWPLDAGFTLRS